MNNSYYPNEHAILCDWFGIHRPKCCHGIDVFNPPKDAEGIWPEQREHHNEEEALDNAVARIVLGAIQRRLPQVKASNRTWEIHRGRRYYPNPRRPMVFLPRFLFSIYWAEAGLEHSRPESYHVTYLPGYDRYVVTASNDSFEAWGYTELALGTFNPNKSILEGTKTIIIDWWQSIQAGWDQQRWALVCDEGFIDRRIADAWAAEVWTGGYKRPEKAV